MMMSLDRQIRDDIKVQALLAGKEVKDDEAPQPDPSAESMDANPQAFEDIDRHTNEDFATRLARMTKIPAAKDWSALQG